MQNYACGPSYYTFEKDNKIISIQPARISAPLLEHHVNTGTIKNYPKYIYTERHNQTDTEKDKLKKRISKDYKFIDIIDTYELYQEIKQKINLVEDPSYIKQIIKEVEQVKNIKPINKQITCYNRSTNELQTIIYDMTYEHYTFNRIDNAYLNEYTHLIKFDNNYYCVLQPDYDWMADSINLGVDLTYIDKVDSTILLGILNAAKTQYLYEIIRKIVGKKESNNKNKQELMNKLGKPSNVNEYVQKCLSSDESKQFFKDCDYELFFKYVRRYIMDGKQMKNDEQNIYLRTVIEMEHLLKNRNYKFENDSFGIINDLLQHINHLKIKKQNIKYTAIFFFEDNVKTMRDLEPKHAPYIKVIEKVAEDVIQKKYGIDPSNLYMYCKYPAESLFKFHLHILYIHNFSYKDKWPYHHTKKMHSIQDIISGLEYDNYYKNALFVYNVNTNMFNRFYKDAYFDENNDTKPDEYKKFYGKYEVLNNNNFSVSLEYSKHLSNLWGSGLLKELESDKDFGERLGKARDAKPESDSWTKVSWQRGGVTQSLSTYFDKKQILIIRMVHQLFNEYDIVYFDKRLNKLIEIKIKPTEIKPTKLETDFEKKNLIINNGSETIYIVDDENIEIPYTVQIISDNKVKINTNYIKGIAIDSPKMIDKQRKGHESVDRYVMFYLSNMSGIGYNMITQIYLLGLENELLYITKDKNYIILPDPKWIDWKKVNKILNELKKDEITRKKFYSNYHFVCWYIAPEFRGFFEEKNDKMIHKIWKYIKNGNLDIVINKSNFDDEKKMVINEILKKNNMNKNKSVNLNILDESNINHLLSLSNIQKSKPVISSIRSINNETPEINSFIHNFFEILNNFIFSKKDHFTNCNAGNSLCYLNSTVHLETTSPEFTILHIHYEYEEPFVTLTDAVVGDSVFKAPNVLSICNNLEKYRDFYKNKYNKRGNSILRNLTKILIS